MSLVAKLYVEDKEINILDFKFRFTRSTDEHGKPMGKPRGTVFEIIFETTSDQSFMSWSIATDMTKHVKIVVSPVTATSKSRIIELYDVHCVHFKNNFNAKDGEPMTTLIHLTPAIMIDDGYKVLDHYWKKTDLSANAPVTVLKKDEEEGKVIDYYLIDSEGTRIDEIGEEKEIFLVLETEEMTGKKITINLSSKSHDFEYQGERLENDILRNYQIQGEQDKIKLKVLPANS